MPPARLRPILFSAAILAVLTAVLTVVVPAGIASAATVTAAGNRVWAISPAAQDHVRADRLVSPGQHLGEPRSCPICAPGACVAPEADGAAPRFIANGAGDVLDTSRITIPEGKFSYLLENPSKSGVFSDSMGFDKATLGSALRNQLAENFGNASPEVPMFNGEGAQIGVKFTVRSALTGPSGATWDITSAWGIDWNGTIRLITATP